MEFLAAEILTEFNNVFKIKRTKHFRNLCNITSDYRAQIISNQRKDGFKTTLDYIIEKKKLINSLRNKDQGLKFRQL